MESQNYELSLFHNLTAAEQKSPMIFEQEIRH